MVYKKEGGGNRLNTKTVLDLILKLFYPGGEKEHTKNHQSVTAL